MCVATPKTFTQIVSSARMGSSMYAPLRFRGRVLGLVTLASQARHTYDAGDLVCFEILANHAAACWVAHGGPVFLDAQKAGARLRADRGRSHPR